MAWQQILLNDEGHSGTVLLPVVELVFLLSEDMLDCGYGGKVESTLACCSKVLKPVVIEMADHLTSYFRREVE